MGVSECVQRKKKTLQPLLHSCGRQKRRERRRGGKGGQKHVPLVALDLLRKCLRRGDGGRRGADQGVLLPEEPAHSDVERRAYSRMPASVRLPKKKPTRALPSFVEWGEQAEALRAVCEWVCAKRECVWSGVARVVSSRVWAGESVGEARGGTVAGRREGGGGEGRADASGCDGRIYATPCSARTLGGLKAGGIPPSRRCCRASNDARLAPREGPRWREKLRNFSRR